MSEIVLEPIQPEVVEGQEDVVEAIPEAVSETAPETQEPVSLPAAEPAKRPRGRPKKVVDGDAVAAKPKPKPKPKPAQEPRIEAPSPPANPPLPDDMSTIVMQYLHDRQREQREKRTNLYKSFLPS